MEKIWKFYKDTLTTLKNLILGEFDGQNAAFLIQNMFPVTEKYIDHIHTKNGNPVPVKRELQRVIR